MEHTAINLDACLQEVRQALSTVCDPELDESVTELGFIQDVSIGKDGDVSVSFRLPTYWCSANFAYLMASDMHNAITRLPWIGKVSIQLTDHFTAAEVSTGTSSGKSFQESFSLEAGEDLDGIRLIFRRKSFQKRQEVLLRHLLGQGETIDELVSMSLAALEYRTLDVEGSALRDRYLQARAVLGFDREPSGPVIHDVEGKTLDTAEFADYLLGLRRVRLNTEFNATICRGLLEVRYGVRQEDGLTQIDGVVARETAAVFHPHQQTTGVRSFMRYRTQETGM
jgi:metal-sulfur cluster biosynthetic enzyme